MKWKKLEKIFEINKINEEWLYSHAMMPVVEKISSEEIRVYFSPRDIRNRSRCASFNYNLKTKKISKISQKPILDLGERGCFDDSGVMPTCVVTDKDTGKKYMYYNGWTLGGTIPFFSFNGIAISSNDGTSFQKLGRYPVALNRDEIDPYSTFAPFVIKEGEKWRMWYVSLIKWEEEDFLKHYYHIKYAESKDGINWIRKGKICIDFKNEYEYAIARPCVLKDKNIYKMWYSYRASEEVKTYRIGYAESKDGVNWIRKDEEMKEFTVSDDGWDSEMVCYSYVFEYKDKLYMLYNGNGYGKTGIGLAVLEEE
jgi:hypothetical protein